MKCPYCATTLPDDAVFCASCGKRVADAAAPAAQEPQQQPAGSGTAAAIPAGAAAATRTSASPVPSPLATKKGKGIAAGIAVAVACVIAAIVFAVSAAGNVPEDTVRQALQASSTVASGVASDNYVEPEPYSLDAFKIDKQQDEPASTLGMPAAGTDKVRHVYFSGTIANDYFKTDFSGEAYYTKQGDTWACLLGPSINDSTTTPLKGVSMMTSSSVDNDYEVSNFASTLDSDNGSYTSTATQNVTYSFWFGTDTATNTRTFVFDGSGWTPTGDVAVSNMQSNTNFAGKKFEYMDTGSSFFKTGTTTSTIEFTNDGDNGKVSATYTLNWKYSGDTTSGSGQYYLPVSLSGNLEGTIDHSFGQDDFDIELNDADNQVSFTGGDSYTTVSAGDGETNTLSLSVSTNAKSFESPYQTSMYRLSMGTWVEKA